MLHDFSEAAKRDGPYAHGVAASIAVPRLAVEVVGAPIWYNTTAVVTFMFEYELGELWFAHARRTGRQREMVDVRMCRLPDRLRQPAVHECMPECLARPR